MVAVFSQPVSRPAEGVVFLAHLINIVIIIIIIASVNITIIIIVIIIIVIITWSSLSSWLLAVSC